MIDSKELRIGNWVFDDENRPCQISALSSDKRDKYEGYFDGEDISIEFPDNESIYATKVINPIPLTEEILLKCGFEKWSWCDNCAFTSLFLGDSLYCRYYQDQWHIKRMKVGRDSKGVFGKSEGKYIVPKGQIKHLHQFQNLYFALTQTELQIKL